jgi:hypothetical protein
MFFSERNDVKCARVAVNPWSVFLLKNGVHSTYTDQQETDQHATHQLEIFLKRSLCSKKKFLQNNFVQNRLDCQD